MKTVASPYNLLSVGTVLRHRPLKTQFRNQIGSLWKQDTAMIDPTLEKFAVESHGK